MGQAKQKEELKDIVKHIEEEARMVLPGIQALFGFQLIAVFNTGFAAVLSPLEQKIHVLALILSAVSGTLVIAPAAFHRQVEPHFVSQRFADLAGKFLSVSLIPLGLGTCLDLYLIANVVFKNQVFAFVASGFLFFFMTYFWYWYPHRRKLRD